VIPCHCHTVPPVQIRPGVYLAGGIHPGNDTKTPVAYRSPGGLYLYCTRHADDVGGSWTPLDSDDLPDGGLCAQCGADVLIPQQPKG
jgi:hypothetical protein